MEKPKGKKVRSDIDLLWNDPKQKDARVIIMSDMRKRREVLVENCEGKATLLVRTFASFHRGNDIHSAKQHVSCGICVIQFQLTIRHSLADGHNRSRKPNRHCPSRRSSTHRLHPIVPRGSLGRFCSFGAATAQRRASLSAATAAATATSSASTIHAAADAMADCAHAAASPDD